MDYNEQEASDIVQAAREGNLDRVKIMIENNARMVDAVGGLVNNTPLLAAAGSGHYVIVQYLLDSGASINQRNMFEKTALHQACVIGNRDIVSLLLQRGACPRLIDDSGKTALIVACMWRRDAVVAMLLEHGGSDIDTAERVGFATALLRACHEGHSGMVKKLLEAGSDPTHRDVEGRTAMAIAELHNHQECIEVLQEWDRAYFMEKTRRLIGT